MKHLLTLTSMLYTISTLVAQTEHYAVTLHESFAHKLSPVYMNGYLIGRDKKDPRITLYAKDGSVRNIDLELPAASTFKMGEASVSENGGLAVIGRIQTGEKSVGALILNSLDSPAQKIVLLKDFGPIKVAHLKSGKIVIYGREVDSKNETVRGSDALRLYASSGLLEKSGLPRTMLTNASGKPEVAMFLVTDGERIVFLNDRAGRVFEFDNQLLPVSSNAVSPTVFEDKIIWPCAYKHPLVHCASSNEANPQIRDRQSLWTLNVTTGEYQDITEELNVPAVDVGMFAGLDGERLVIRKKAKQTMSWIERGKR